MLPRKMKVPGSNPSVLMGSNSLIAVFAGVLAVVGVSTLHKRKMRQMISHAKPATRSNQVQVGLLKLHAPRNFRDLVKNDVLIEKAIENVSHRLIIHVAGNDKHEIVNYTSELYCLVWDTACLFGKELLDIRIIGALPEERFTSWDELILRPELNAVFGEDSFVDVERLNERRFEIDGLFAVTYHPLSMYIEKRLSPDFKYFEDEKSDLTPQDTVILGGTFDHLHNGHKKLLSLAASICKRRVVVGVTAHSMLLKKSHVHLIEHVEKRKSKVHAYLSFLNPQLKIEVVTINDPFGPAITIEEPAALVVSTETIAGAVKINEIRQDRHLQRLQVYVCRRTEASTLSSSYIREKLAARGVRS